MKNIFQFDDDASKFWFWFLFLTAITVTLCFSIATISRAYQCVHAPSTCIEQCK